MGNREIMQGSASRGGQGSSVASFSFNEGSTDHVLSDRAVFSNFESWSERTSVENPNGNLVAPTTDAPQPA